MELPGTATQRKGAARQGTAKQWKSKARLSRGTAQSGDQLTGKGTAECSRATEMRRIDEQWNRKGMATIGGELS